MIVTSFSSSALLYIEAAQRGEPHVDYPWLCSRYDNHPEILALRAREGIHIARAPPGEECDHGPETLNEDGEHIVKQAATDADAATGDEKSTMDNDDSETKKTIPTGAAASVTSVSSAATPAAGGDTPNNSSGVIPSPTLARAAVATSSSATTTDVVAPDRN